MHLPARKCYWAGEILLCTWESCCMTSLLRREAIEEIGPVKNWAWDKCALRVWALNAGPWLPSEARSSNGSSHGWLDGERAQIHPTQSLILIPNCRWYLLGKSPATYIYLPTPLSYSSTNFVLAILIDAPTHACILGTRSLHMHGNPTMTSWTGCMYIATGNSNSCLSLFKLLILKTSIHYSIVTFWWSTRSGMTLYNILIKYNIGLKK